MPTILELFQNTPNRYSQPQENLVDFTKVNGLKSPLKVDTTPFSDNITKELEKDGIYSDVTRYKYGINYSLPLLKKDTTPYSDDKSLELEKGGLYSYSNWYKYGTNYSLVKSDKQTLLSQELNGIRRRTAVDLNNPRLYGSETIRIVNRTTSLVEDMKAQTGGQAATGGLIGKGLGKLTGGKINSISQTRDAFNSFLGIPVTQIPSRVSNKVIELSTSRQITSQDVITKELIGGNGTGFGRFLKDLGGGDFKTLGKQALGNGIGLAKDKLRGALFGKPQTIGEAVGEKIQLTYNNTNSYSIVLKTERRYKSEGGDAKEFDAIDISLVSPTYGVRRKDGEFGSLKSGNDEIYGFVYRPKPNSKKPLSRYAPELPYTKTYNSTKDGGFTQTELSKRSLENKRGLSNGLDVINMITSGDSVKIDDNGEFAYAGHTYSDLIPFYIGKLGSPVTMFRSNIKGITETVSPSWNSHKFLGNPYQFYTYSQIERSVAFSLQIYTSSPLELATNWQKISDLTKMTYPSFNANNLVTPPIIQFRLGDIYNDKIGFIESLSYTIPDDSTWETEINGAKLPKFIDVSLTIKFIEDSTSSENLYGFKKSAEAVKAINSATRANEYTDMPRTGVDSFTEPAPPMTPRGIVLTKTSLNPIPNINIVSPLTQGSIKDVPKSVDTPSSSTEVQTPEKTESAVTSPIVAQSAMVDVLKAETPAAAVVNNTEGSTDIKQRVAITSFYMKYKDNNPKVISKEQLPAKWNSDVDPVAGSKFVTMNFIGKNMYWHIAPDGTPHVIHEETPLPKFDKPKSTTSMLQMSGTN